jgi:hypothetical protein
MKASSIGLEIDIQVSQQEIIELKTKRLEALLRFRENSDSEIRKIPLSLVYAFGNSQEIRVMQEPDNTYFGKARRISIILDDFNYQKLLNTGFCCDRFYKSGKVSIFKS